MRLAFCCLLLAAGAALAQGTADDYKRSDALGARLRGKVFRTRVEPTWFAGDRRFWYRNDLAKGEREYVLVDADAGTREPAFDHARLAAALAKASGKKFDPTRLSLEDLQFSDDDATATFSAAGKRWRLDRKTHEIAEAPKAAEKDTPVAQKQKRRPAAGNLSPDGRWRAVVRDHNIHLVDATSKEAVALSKEGKAEDGYTGEVYWSPDSKRLVALRTKAGTDRKVHLLESSPRDSHHPKLHTMTYRKPGDDIPLARPHLFDIEARKEIAVGDDLFPNPWSVTQARWDGDSKRFTFLYNQRGHQVMRVVAIDAQTGKTSSVVEEKCKTFFDYQGKLYLHWLSDDELIWMSERDGWNHLYLYDARSGKVKNQITKGEWVVRSVERVDARGRQVTFRAGGIHPKQDPYYLHHARIDLDGTNLVLLTDADGHHGEVSYSPGRKYLIATHSRVDRAPATELRRASDGTKVCELEKADIKDLRAAGWRAPERFVARGRDGQTDIYGVIFRPTNFDPTRKYPVIEDIYAGPHSAFVPKGFQPYFRQQGLAELGFIVVKIDGMGTSHRSKAFHDVCWKNLGDSGFPDRIAWIKAAAKKYPEMDISKVGIYGGSAGGQSSTQAMLAHGDFYKVAVSDCGCHDNRVDKIWWNELWMGWPIGPHYAAQSNVTNAHKLTGKLMLIVGEMDRNVDPVSTLQVVNALIRANKDFELLFIPGAGHGAGESPYGQRRRKDFFVRHLLGVEPRR